MTRWHRVVALAITVVVVNAVTQVVIRANLAAGLYPPGADAIGVPILSTLYLSLILSPWLLLLALFSRFKAVRAYSSRGGMRSVLVIAATLVLYVPALLFAAGGIAYWTGPGHYPIAAAFALYLLVLMALAWDDFRTLRPDSASSPPQARPPRAAPVRGEHDQLVWYAITAALFLYALPFIHNLGCLELPFETGYDLAFLYLGVPAAIVAIFGGRWIGRRLGFLSALAGAALASVVLFAWLVLLGQGVVMLANVTLSPQRAVTYQGVIVDKFKSGYRQKDHMLRIRVAPSERAVIEMAVSDREYARLSVGDRMASPMVLGALNIPYVPRCRWLANR